MCALVYSSCVYVPVLKCVQTFVGMFCFFLYNVVVCVCVCVCVFVFIQVLFYLLLSVRGVREHRRTRTHTHAHTHTSFYSLGGLTAYYGSLVGEGGENKRLTTLKWQQTAETERFTSLIPAHRDLKELSM